MSVDRTKSALRLFLSIRPPISDTEQSLWIFAQKLDAALS